MFDEEGFFITGDTVSFVDATKPEQGLVFAGRAKEEFKLATGTWVRAGQLRAELVDTLSPLVKDVVIVGENRDDVRALLWLDDESAMDTVKERLARLASTVRGQSRRVVAAAPLETPPDPAKGEITAKGTLNQIRLRRNRIHEISELYNEPVPNFLNK
jgi:feruloyl-CoA synthase